VNILNDLLIPINNKSENPNKYIMARFCNFGEEKPQFQYFLMI